MALKRPVFFVVGAGLLTFAVVFMLLAFSSSVAAPSQNVVAPTREPTPVVTLAADSLAPQLAANQVALGVPASGSEALLRDVQTGDRLDVLASLPSPVDAQPLTVVVVRGATVLRAPTAGDPLLLSVSGSDAIALAHLILGGTSTSSASGMKPRPMPIPCRAAWSSFRGRHRATRWATCSARVCSAMATGDLGW